MNAPTLTLVPKSPTRANRLPDKQETLKSDELRKMNAQTVQDKLIEHKLYIDKHGEDLPEVRNWKWGSAK